MIQYGEENMRESKIKEGATLSPGNNESADGVSLETLEQINKLLTFIRSFEGKSINNHSEYQSLEVAAKELTDLLVKLTPEQCLQHNLPVINPRLLYVAPANDETYSVAA